MNLTEEIPPTLRIVLPKSNTQTLTHSKKKKKKKKRNALTPTAQANPQTAPLMESLPFPPSFSLSVADLQLG